MGTRILDNDVVAGFRAALEELPGEEQIVAIVGREAEHWPEAVAAAQQCASGVVLLEEDLPLHGYKRALNEQRCGCLMYGPGYEELAYRINNDGVTLVSDYIKIV